MFASSSSRLSPNVQSMSHSGTVDPVAQPSIVLHDESPMASQGRTFEIDPHMHSMRHMTGSRPVSAPGMGSGMHEYEGRGPPLPSMLAFTRLPEADRTDVPFGCP